MDNMNCRLLKLLMLLFLFLSCFGCEKKIENKESHSFNFDEILWWQSGELIYEDDKVLVDYSNSNDGYILAKTKTYDHSRIKIMIIKDDEKYTYDLNKELEFESYPLNMGDGTYSVKAYENLSDDEYALLYSLDIEVSLDNEFTPFLYPNQIVDYNSDTKCIAKSFELVKDDTTDLDRVDHIYHWVLDNVTYDWDKVEQVQGKYVLPVLDDIYDNGKGICFDYAAIMAAMLRVQHIPTKVVTGMVSEGYHAWIEVYIENMGWIKPHVYFNSGKWTQMDPTYDAMDRNYDGDYSVKYTY